MDFEKELAAAQLATLIDTDGCIYAFAQRKRNGFYVSPGISFYNTNRALIEHFRAQCQRLGIQVPDIGGPRQRSRPHHKPYFAVYIRARRTVAALLSWILRYLVAKRAQGAFLFEIAARAAQLRGAGQPQWVRDFAARIYRLNDDRCQSRARVMQELVCRD